MSAGGLSYSGLTNYGKVTLPSVETWGTNMNILRDPSRSITTRRINKVGETSSITQMVDDSGNRACEAIRVYARGVNPSVSVSYDNYGSNSGGQAGSLPGLGNPITGCGRQAKLPYTIMKDGAFRPPVLTQEDTMPLSRLPRVWTTAFSQPGFTDFSRKARVCGTALETKEVKNKCLKACVRPTATYIVETPIPEPFEVKYIIQPTLKTTANSGIRSMDVTSREVKEPTKEIYIEPLHADAHTKKIDPSRYVSSSELKTQPYIQDANAHRVDTNMSSNKNYTDISEILDLVDLPVKDIRTTSHIAPKSHSAKVKYIHNDLRMERNLPRYQYVSNKTDNTKYKRNQHTNNIELERNIPTGSFQTNFVSRGKGENGSRDAKLPPKAKIGGFHNSGQRPLLHRTQQIQENHDTQKAKTSRFVVGQMHERYGKPAPWTK